MSDERVQPVIDHRAVRIKDDRLLMRIRVGRESLAGPNRRVQDIAFFVVFLEFRRRPLPAKAQRTTRAKKKYHQREELDKVWDLSHSPDHQCRKRSIDPLR